VVWGAAPVVDGASPFACCPFDWVVWAHGEDTRWGVCGRTTGVIGGGSSPCRGAWPLGGRGSRAPS
jgi:hypothetical protein